MRTMTMYVGSFVARLLSSRYTKGTEQSIFWVNAISKEVCFVLFLAGFPELVRGAFSTPPVGHQSPRTIRLPSTQAATTVFSGGAPDAGAARLPLQPGRLPSGLMCAFVIARATHTLLDLARCLISALYASWLYLTITFVEADNQSVCSARWCRGASRCCFTWSRWCRTNMSLTPGSGRTG